MTNDNKPLVAFLAITAVVLSLPLSAQSDWLVVVLGQAAALCFSFCLSSSELATTYSCDFAISGRLFPPFTRQMEASGRIDYWLCLQLP